MRESLKNHDEENSYCLKYTRLHYFGLCSIDHCEFSSNRSSVIRGRILNEAFVTLDNSNELKIISTIVKPQHFDQMIFLIWRMNDHWSNTMSNLQYFGTLETISNHTASHHNLIYRVHELTTTEKTGRHSICICNKNYIRDSSVLPQEMNTDLQWVLYKQNLTLES